MTRLAKLIDELCPDGVEYKRLGELGSFYSGLTGKNKKDFVDGNAKYITYVNVFSNPGLKNEQAESVKISKDENQTTLKLGDVIFTGSSETKEESGMSSVVTEEPAEELYLNSFCFVWRPENKSVFEPNFLKYLFRSHEIRKRIIKTSNGVTRFNVSKEKMKKVLIPVPPLEIQREIVRILDKFTELKTKLNAELAAEQKVREQQYEYYLNKVFESEKNVQWKSMGDLFPQIRNGFVGTIKPYFTDKEHGVRYLEGTNIHDGTISDNEVLYVTKEFHQKHINNALKADDILMVQSGHIGECAVVGDKYKGANCHALIIMSNGGKCDSQYVSYYFHSNKGRKSLKPAITGGTIKHVLATKMKNVKIPVPPLAEQQRIVDVLDRFDAICHDLTAGLPAEIEARQKQYEYYRDKLLTFKRKEA